MEDYKKKYEDALNAARKFKYNCPLFWDTKSNPFKDVFEELKESDDERIRKEIIDYLNREITLSNFGGDIATFKKWIAWLDEQKHTNKVEPKFKIGDWIVYRNEDVVTITDIVDNGYLINKGGCIPFTSQGDMRYWTIQDTKDGDVLVTNSRPFIFRGFIDKCYPKDPVAYCGIDSTNEFFVPENVHWTLNSCSPATEEQRDLLFSKMKEAGYEWDAEKKELKKIEQKYVWSEEDENMLNHTIGTIELHLNHVGSDRKEILLVKEEIDWLKSLRDKMKGE